MPSPISLPARELVRILGLEGALKLVDAFGGREVYLCNPSHVRAGNRVAEAIGLDAARQLCAEWPQLDVRVPRLASELRRARSRAIRADRETMTIDQIAQRYGITMRTVQLALAEPQEADEPARIDESQLDLFNAA